MSLKSKTCIGKKYGKPLTEYSSESEAREAALFANASYKRHLLPYHRGISANTPQPRYSRV